jgi:hypothetical protein
VPWQRSEALGVSGVNFGAKDDANSSSSSSHVLVALNYPSIRIGPYSWRYFRGKLGLVLLLYTYFVVVATARLWDLQIRYEAGVGQGQRRVFVACS